MLTKSEKIFLKVKLSLDIKYFVLNVLWNRSVSACIVDWLVWDLEDMDVYWLFYPIIGYFNDKRWSQIIIKSMALLLEVKESN